VFYTPLRSDAGSEPGREGISFGMDRHRRVAVAGEKTKDKPVMIKIPNINDLSMVYDRADGHITVYYTGKSPVGFPSDGECHRIGHREVLCEQPTSYFGCVMDRIDTFKTPLGIVERYFTARGAGLDECSVSWRIVPHKEIEEACEKYTQLSLQLDEQRKIIELFNCKRVE